MELRGLIKDGAFDGNSGQWARARNIIYSVKPKPHIDNEEGFDITGTINTIVVGIIGTPQKDIYFSTDGIYSEIGILENDIYSVRIKSKLLNFNKLFPIIGKFDYNHKKELVVVWTDNYNEVRILNVDSLPFGVDETTKDFTDPKDIELLNLFPSQSFGNIELDRVLDTNGSLKTGVYFFILSYGFADESFLNYQSVTNKVFITDDSKNIGNFDTHDGSMPGESTNKAIALKIENLDMRYTYFKVGVIAQIGGIISAYETNKLHILSSNTNLLISNLDSLNSSSINKFLAATAVYPYAKTLTVSNTKLALANVKEPKPIDFQSRANNITIKWYKGDFVSLDALETSYKDPNTVFIRTGFKAGEVYAFYIKLNHKKGYTSGIYHIPGRASASGDKAIIDTPFAGRLDNEVHKFQIQDTSTRDGNSLSGNMSYWENRNEFYPQHFLNLAYQNVRHHKFPTLSAIETHGIKNFEDMSSIGGNDDSTFGGNVDLHDTNYNIKFISPYPSTEFGIFGTEYKNTNLVNTFKAAFNQEVIVTLSLYMGVESLSDSYNIHYYIKDGNGNIVDSGDEQMSVIGFPNASIYTKTFNLLQNYTLGIYGTTVFPDDTVTIDNNLSTYSFNASGSSAVVGSRFARPFGIIISGVDFEGFEDEIDSFEILYAERTIDNMTIIGQSLLYPFEVLSTNYVFAENSYLRMHPFEIMSSKLNVMPNYISNELSLIVSDGSIITEFFTKTTIFSDCRVHSTERPYTAVADGQKLVFISDFKYYPPDNTATNPSNVKKENCVGFKIDSALSSGTNKRYLSNLCVYKQDIYRDWMNQSLVSTGRIISVGELNAQPLILYGGDTFIGTHSVTRLRGSIKNEGIDIPALITISLFYCESIYNLGLRHEDPLIPKSKYHTKTERSELFSNAYLAIDESNPTDAFNREYLINKDYSKLNDFVKGIITIPNINIVNRFPFRIVRSLPQEQENVALNWRTFLTSDYYEMPRTKGEIWNIVSQGEVLFIQMERSIYVAVIKDVFSTINEDLYLRTGDLFDRLPEEKIPTDEGYIGNKSMFGTILTKHGLITVDRLSGKVFWFKSIDEIVDISESNSEFFKELLTMDVGDLTDPDHILVNQQLYLAASQNVPIEYRNNQNEMFKAAYNIDNPLIDKSVVLSWDDKHERAILVVNNIERYPMGDTVEFDWLEDGLIQIGVDSVENDASSFFFSVGEYEIKLQYDIDADALNVDFDLTADDLVYYFGEPDSPTEKKEVLIDALNTLIGILEYNNVFHVVGLESDSFNIIYRASEYDVRFEFDVTSVSDDLVLLQHRLPSKVIDKSKTLTFSIKGGFWVCDHDYIPTLMSSMNRPNNILTSVKVNTDSIQTVLATHNVKGKYGKYYNQTVIHPSFFDYIISSKSDKDFLLESIMWETTMEKDGTSTWDKTLSHIAIYNEQQCSNLYNLVKLTYDNQFTDGNLAHHYNEWRFNKFTDDLVKRNVLFIDKYDKLKTSMLADNRVFSIQPDLHYMVTNINGVGDSITYDGVTYAINNTIFVGKQGVSTFNTSGNAKVINFKQWFEKSNFIDKLAILRLYYDNLEQYKLSLTSIKMNAKSIS